MVERRIRREWMLPCGLPLEPCYVFEVECVVTGIEFVIG